MSELADLSIGEAARHLCRRKVSAQELTEACLARLGTWRVINAFLWIDTEGAMASAKASDRRRRRHARGPLDGIPVAHKDIFKRAGQIMTVGSIILDQPATETATVLRRLDRAGAIELGRLHTSEFAGGATGHNRHYGPCRNPWDVRRTPGGSSGGSAAALAAGLVFGSLGTDTGGSLRLPAHFLRGGGAATHLWQSKPIWRIPTLLDHRCSRADGAKGGRPCIAARRHRRARSKRHHDSP